MTFCVNLCVKLLWLVEILSSCLIWPISYCLIRFCMRLWQSLLYGSIFLSKILSIPHNHLLFLIPLNITLFLTGFGLSRILVLTTISGTDCDFDWLFSWQLLRELVKKFSFKLHLQSTTLNFNLKLQTSTLNFCFKLQLQFQL